MSYLSLASLPLADFSKITLSMWFRVPQASIDAAAAAYISGSNALFNGIIPLAVMGKKGKGFSPGGDFDLNPTYIGLDCSQASVGGVYLNVNFETFQAPTINIGFTNYLTVSVSSIDRIPVSANAWHHVLISVDLGSQATHGWAWDADITDYTAFLSHFDTLSHLYIAFDDVNKTGVDLSGDWPNGFSDLHAVVTSDAYSIANTIQASASSPGVPEHPTGPIPTYSAAALAVPCHEQAMGLPAPSVFLANVRHVEMAEFQMWTGAMLDTGVTANRRAFIDSNGKPVSPNKKASPDDPQSGSIELMGRPPDITLHKSGNWIMGNNTGSLIASFDPTGEIKAYKPDPSLIRAQRRTMIHTIQNDRSNRKIQHPGEEPAP